MMPDMLDHSVMVGRLQSYFASIAQICLDTDLCQVSMSMDRCKRVCVCRFGATKPHNALCDVGLASAHNFRTLLSSEASKPVWILGGGDGVDARLRIGRKVCIRE